MSLTNTNRLIRLSRPLSPVLSRMAAAIPINPFHIFPLEDVDMDVTVDLSENQDKIDRIP